MKKDLREKIFFAKNIIVNSFSEYVRVKGDEMSEYYYNEFGINEQDDGCEIISVLNFRDNYGCTFSCDGLAYAIWAIYICRDLKGEENLMYCGFMNEGDVYDNEESEWCQGNVFSFKLDFVSNIIDTIEYMDYE